MLELYSPEGELRNYPYHNRKLVRFTGGAMSEVGWLMDETSQDYLVDTVASHARRRWKKTQCLILPDLKRGGV